MGERNNTIVFTGTQHGMTEQQLRVVQKFFARRGRRLLHGCCVGADKQANDAWRDVFGEVENIWGYPSNIREKTADCIVGIKQAPAPPIERNHTMIDEAIECGEPVCLATPKEDAEVLRSGTWATIRYAKKRNVPTFAVFPDGSWTWQPLEPR